MEDLLPGARRGTTDQQLFMTSNQHLLQGMQVLQTMQATATAQQATAQAPPTIFKENRMLHDALLATNEVTQESDLASY